MQCTNPFQITDPKGLKHKVPCNRCLGCRINRVSVWSLRILSELPITEGKGIFLTLTYDPFYLPYVKGSCSMIPTLRIDDIKKFIKRLRKKIKIHKYFAVGEYGETYSRPHYHIIMLGIEKKDEKLIRDTWGMGNIQIGTITTASIRYVASYIMDKDCDEKYDGAEPPYMHCSKNFGTKFFASEMPEIIRKGFIRGSNGERMAIPKYIIQAYPEYFANKSLQQKLAYNRKRGLESIEDIILDDIINEQNDIDRTHVNESKKKLFKRGEGNSL